MGEIEILPPEPEQTQPLKPWLWAKGKSGNPAGDHDNKLKVQVLRYARSKGMKAIRKLTELMDNPKAAPSTQLMAAMALLDRGFGKPKQELSVEQTGRSLEDILIAIAQQREQERIAVQKASEDPENPMP